MATLVTEITSLRTREAKHFSTDEENTYIAVVQNEQHFLHEDGYWEETGNLIQQLPDGTYRTQGQFVQFRVEPQTGTYHIDHQGNTITFQPASLCLYDMSSGSVYKLADVNPNPTFEFNKEANQLVWKDIFPNVDLSIGLRELYLQKQIVFRSRPIMPDLLSLGMNPDTTRLVITFVGKSETPVSLNQASTESGWMGAIQDTLYIEYGNGSRLTIPMAIGWGSANRPPRNLEYVRDANVNFGIAAPYSFIQIARYPVYIDPTVTLQPSVVTDDAFELSQSTQVLPIPLTYGSTSPDQSRLNYQSCGAFVTGGGKDPLSYQAARYFVRFNLNSIPYLGTLVSATLSLNVLSGTVDPTVKTLDIIPNWTVGSTPGATQWNVASQGTPSSTSVAGTVENYVFTSNIDAYFGNYCAFRIRYTSEANNIGTATDYIGFGNTVNGPTFHPKLTVVYNSPVNYPTPTLVETKSVTNQNTTSTALSTPVAVGDLLIVAVSGTVTALPWQIPFAFSDNLGNTYTQFFTTNNGLTSFTATMAGFYSIVTNAGTPTINLYPPPSYNSLCWQVLHFNGCTFAYDTATQFQASEAAGPYIAPVVNSTTLNTLLIGVVGLYQTPGVPTVTPMQFPPVTFNTPGEITNSGIGSNTTGLAIQYAQVGMWQDNVFFSTNGSVSGMGVAAIAFKLSAGVSGGTGGLPRNALIGQ